MVKPSSPNESNREISRFADNQKTRKVLNARFFFGTFVALAVVGSAAYFWRAYQLRRTSSALSERAESLADEKDFMAAANYYGRYLELCPEDANARLRRAELFEQAIGGRGFLRTVELYQEALKPAKQELTLERQLEARRRLTELLIQAGKFAAAEDELKKLQDLEQKELKQKPEEWRWPGLNALTLAGKFRDNNSAVSRKDVEEAFRVVIEPKADEKKVYQDPAVYLARYTYRLPDPPRADDAKAAEAFLTGLTAAKPDLDAALKLAPTNILVLLTAAGAAQREAAAVMAVQRAAAIASVGQRAAATAPQEASRDKAQQSYSKAREYYERVIEVAPSDPRAYRGLGQLYTSLGNRDRAIKTWQDGLKAVKGDSDGIGLNFDLAEGLIQQRRLADAETVLKNLDGVLAKLDSKTRFSLQHLVDLRTAKLLLLKGHYKEAIDHLADLVVSKEIEGGKDIIQHFGGTTIPQVIYEAWMLLGQSHAALGLDQSPEALEHRKQALVAFEQAALLQPREITPRLAAAEVSKAAGRRDDAIESYRQALAIVDAMKPPPAGQRQAIYEALISLLDEQKRPAEAERYRTLRQEQMAESAQLTLRGVDQAIRNDKPADAVEIAQRGVQGHPDDPMAYIALGLARRANKADAEATAAYRKAFETAKDAPALQMQLVDYLLKTGNLSDAAEAEKALRDLLPRHPPAGLRLVGLLELRNKNDEALAVAQSGVQSHPKDAVAHVALGTAWWGKKENAKAEAAFQEAVRLAPDDAVPVLALMGYYAGTGQSKLARDTLDKILQKAKLPAVDLELLRADGLARLGDRKDAKDAYLKAVEAAKEDPAVQMRLAEFLLGSSDPADEAEAEKVLHSIMGQHDPARRRLVEVLVARGGEQEWEEAQKLLEHSPGEADDPASMVDRFAQVRLLVRRGGTKNLAQAADKCEELLKEAKRPPPAVCLLLAQIRELQDNPEEARKQYRLLVDQEHPATAQLAAYVAFLLRRGPAEEADQRLKQLEKLAPEGLSVAEMRARWLRDQNRIKEIEPLVEVIAGKLLDRVGKDNPGQEAQLVVAIGDLFQRIEQFTAAERWYRRMLKLSPDRYEPLAMSLAKQGRIQEAIALCNEAGKTDTSVRPAILVTMVLLSGRATSQDLAGAESYLKKALDTYKDQPALLASVANIRLLQDRAGEAIQLYRQILAQQPKNIEVLNNLATMLAEQPDPEKRKEALEYVEQAINLVGPQPGLLDTKGMALFHDGKPDQAVGLLKEAAQSPNPDPRYSFHLAVACGRLGQLDQGRAALKKARAGDLDHQLLTKMDRQLLAELEKKLGVL